MVKKTNETTVEKTANFVEVRVPDKGGNAPGGDVIVNVLRHTEGLKISVHGSRADTDYIGMPKKIALDVSIGAKDASIKATATVPEGQSMDGNLTLKSNATHTGTAQGCAAVPLNTQVTLHAQRAEQIKGLGEMLLAAGTTNAQQGIASQLGGIALQIADATKDASCRPNAPAPRR